MGGRKPVIGVLLGSLYIGPRYGILEEVSEEVQLTLENMISNKSQAQKVTLYDSIYMKYLEQVNS